MAKKARDEAIRDFLARSTEDLESAKVLYDQEHFANGLYLLQQSSEKLAKALWLRMGFLTPKQARQDRVIQSWLGFQPKEPKQYGHRIVPHLVSDVERSIPSVQRLVDFLEDSELAPRVSDFVAAYYRGKRTVKQLKKRPFTPVGSAEQLEKEVKAAKAALDMLDQTTEKMTEEIGRLDNVEMLRVASVVVRRLGFRVDTEQYASQMPSFVDNIKQTVMQIFRNSFLAMMSAVTATLLDPLEAVTRYPDPQRFDKNHPYIKNFIGLHDLIADIIQKASEQESRVP